VILFFVLIVVLLIGLTTAAAMGKIGGFMADPTSSQSFGGVPEGPLSTSDLVELRFDQALRGYRMDQVDEVIDALSARIRDLESEVASVSAPGGELPAPVEPEALGGGRDEVSSDTDDPRATREH
jgi:DivIVA domain-containing protein